MHDQNGGHLLSNQSWSMIRVRKYVKWIFWPSKHMFTCKYHVSRCESFKVTAAKHFFYFGWQPFWKVGKNDISHARIPWGFFGVDTGTIRNRTLLESVCLQFCLGSPYIWAILTRLHYKDKMVSWLSYPHNENLHTWKDSLYIGTGPCYDIQYSYGNVKT